MRTFIKSTIIFILTVSPLFLSACKNTAPGSDFLNEYFNTTGLDGTVILHSLKTEKEFIYNKERSEKRYLPASTFKVPHTLIALEEGVITNDTEIIKWDGTNYPFKSWNKDQTLVSALKFSCVWFFQKFTKKISNKKYLAYLKEIEYGNMKTGKDISTFWLDGDLRISAREQIIFLQKLYNEELSFKKSSYAVLKKNLIIEKTDAYTLYAKSGLTLRAKNKVGWYIGYVETGDDVWLFAVNINPRSETDYPLRKKIAYQALYEAGIIKK